MPVLFLKVAQRYLLLCGAQHVAVELVIELLLHPLQGNAVGSAQAGEYCVVVALFFGEVLYLIVPATAFRSCRYGEHSTGSCFPQTTFRSVIGDKRTRFPRDNSNADIYRSNSFYPASAA